MSIQWRLKDMLAPKIGSFRFGHQWHLMPKRQTIFVPDVVEILTQESEEPDPPHYQNHSRRVTYLPMYYLFSYLEGGADSGGHSEGGEYEGSDSGNDNANHHFVACIFLTLWA